MTQQGTIAKKALGLLEARYTPLLTVVLFVWLVFLAAVLAVDADEAVYTLLARGMLDGKWPYRDLFDHKPPLIYVWHLPSALGAGIGGERVLAAGVCAASVPLLASIARTRLGRPRKVKLAVASYVLLLASPYLGVNSNTEVFSLLPLLAAVAAPNPFAAGALLGLTAMTKLVGLVFFPVLAVIWGRRCYLSLLGCALVIAAVSVPFIPIWGDYWTANVTFNARYSGQFSLAERLEIFFIPHPLLVLTAIPVWVAAVIGAIRERDRLLLVWVACGYAVAKGSGFDFTHYYILMTPPLALLAGQGLDDYMRHRAIRIVSPLAVATALSLALGVTVAVSSVWARHPYERFVDDHPPPPGEFYVLGHFSEIYIYAGREPQRRFFFSVPLTLNAAWERQARERLFACLPDVLVIPEEDEHLFPVSWSHDLESHYRKRDEYESGVVLTEPMPPCREERR